MSHLKAKYVKAFGGGEDKNKTKTKTTLATDPYTPWGELGAQAKGQGWYPATLGGDQTEYRNSYSNQFNQVVIPNDQKKGYISVVGNRGGKMSVFIKRADGTIDRTLLKDVRPQDVDAFFRSKVGNIQKRHDSIVAGTNVDRVMPDGSYTPPM